MSSKTSEILLKNNQSTYSDLLIFHTLTFKGAKITYSVVRGDLVEFGDIQLSYNRFANTVKIITVANFDETGVLFCASVNEGHVRLLYMSSNTGIVPIFKYYITYVTL